MRRLFMDRIQDRVVDYRRILTKFGADVVLADMCSFGAATLYELGGPPFSTLGINPLVTPRPGGPAVRERPEARPLRDRGRLGIEPRIGSPRTCS